MMPLAAIFTAGISSVTSGLPSGHSGAWKATFFNGSSPAPRGAGEDPLKKVAFQAPEWPLGKPDVTLDIPAVKIAASGIMDYQHPVVPMTLPEGRWLKATTFRVSDRQVVH